MNPVTDPALLAELEGKRPVTDPALLAKLEGQSQPMAEDAPQPSRGPSAFGRMFDVRRNAGLITPGNIAGAALEPAAQLASSAVASPLAGLSGIAGTLLPGDKGQGARWTEAVQSALTYQPRTQGGQIASEGIAYPFKKYAEFADVSGERGVPSSALPGPFGPALAGTRAMLGQKSPSPLESTLVNTAIQAAPAALGLRGGTPSVGSRLGVRQSAKAPVSAVSERAPGLGGVPKATPSIDELSAQATAAYKRASDAGIKIAPDSFQTLKNQIGVTLNKEGIDPTLHPQTTAAFKRIAETKGELTLDQLETLRKIASDAKGAQAAADQRLAATVVDEIDDYVGSLGRKDVTSGDPKAAAALKEARDLYTRKKKAEEIQDLVSRAETRSKGQFSGSGVENALRTEFRQLALNKKRLRRFTPEEQAAIKKVAEGGRMENAMRFIGRFAPTGPVSGAAATYLGSAIGGVGLGAVPIAALGARALATRMTKGNAAAAEELMRRGPQKPRGLLEPEQTPAGGIFSNY